MISSKPSLAIVVTHPIQYLVPLYRELANRIDVEVLFCHRQDAKGQAAAGFGVEFDWDIPINEGYKHRWLKNAARQPGLSRFLGTNCPELSSVLTPKRYDAVWVNGWNHRCYQQTVFHAKRNGLPVLCRGDSQPGMSSAWWKQRLKAIFYPALLRRYAAHMVVGQRNHEYLTHYGVAKERLFPMPHFVDTCFFAAAAKAEQAGESRSQLRNTWKVPEDALLFLFVGKLIPKKRPMDFIQACLSLFARSSSDRYRAVIIGDGPLRSNLEAAAKPSNGRIVFAGFQNQSQLPACYNAADALVLTSNRLETWGLVVNEAMACGRPVIVSDAAGCAADMVEAGVTGFSYPCGDVQKLEAAMINLSHLLSAKDLEQALEKKCNEHDVPTAADGLLLALEATTKNATR